MRNLVTDQFILIVDTDLYAGNFERYMCAYITGQYGECEVGMELAHDVRDKIQHLSWWNDNILQNTNDHGVDSPVSIEPTPGWFNNGLGEHYLDLEENYAQSIADRVAFQQKNQIPIIEQAELRLKNNNFEGNWNKEACLRTIRVAEQAIADARKLVRYPAYFSVAITVDSLPPDEVWQEFILRVHEFSSNYCQILDYPPDKVAPTITGFRRRQQVTFDVD